MELEKIRNLSDGELGVEGNKTAEQLFRLRFQLNLGQADVVKKIRLLRKDVARINTIKRERELGLRGAEPMLKSATDLDAPAKSATAKKPAAKKTAAKKSAPAAKKTKKEAR